jgi:hypothetical protein
MMEAASTSQMSVNFCQTIWPINPEDSHVHTHCLENLKSVKLASNQIEKLEDGMDFVL